MKELLVKALNDLKDFPYPYRIVFPDGGIHSHGAGTPVFTMHFKTERALFDCMRRASLGFGESYMAEELDVEGDLEQAIHLGFKLIDNHVRPSLLTTLKSLFGYALRRNTLDGSRKNIAAHYDLGNDFYSLWLDTEAQQYTCAYFNSENDTIEQAQRQKLDLVCRKLRLQPGDLVAEAGCGWGGLARHAATHYGVRMHSYNISKEQIAFAREKAHAQGIPDGQIEYIQDDYRNIGKDGTRYDKFVSIGMLEHVGLENYRGLYDLIHRVVKPDGLALVHSISRVAPSRMDPWMEKYIFPGAYIPSLAEMVAPIEKRHRPLHVVDVENLRYHYAKTLDHWCDRLDAHADQIRAEYSEAFLRMFRVYLRSSAAGFRYGGILLYQLLISNGYDDDAPLTRQHFMDAGAARRLNGSATARAAAVGKKAVKKAAKNGARKKAKKKRVRV